MEKEKPKKKRKKQSDPTQLTQIDPKTNNLYEPNRKRNWVPWKRSSKKISDEAEWKRMRELRKNSRSRRKGKGRRGSSISMTVVVVF